MLYCSVSCFVPSVDVDMYNMCKRVNSGILELLKDNGLVQNVPYGGGVGWTGPGGVDPTFFLTNASVRAAFALPW